MTDRTQYKRALINVILSKDERYNWDSPAKNDAASAMMRLPMPTLMMLYRAAWGDRDVDRMLRIVANYKG